MSNSLIKLIDIALLPAALMVLSKFIGLVVVVSLFGIQLDLNSAAESLLNVRPAVLAEDLITISTYSDLIMYLLLAAAFSFILIQATHFHDTHISPRMLVKLSRHNLTGLVQSSFRLYHSAAIWLVVIWIATSLIWINVLNQTTQLWTGVAVLIASITFTTILIQDVYKEIELGQRQVGKHNALS